MQIVSSIVRKKYLSEMDLLRLQKALLLCTHGRRQHLSRGQTGAWLLEQA